MKLVFNDGTELANVRVSESVQYYYGTNDAQMLDVRVMDTETTAPTMYANLRDKDFSVMNLKDDEGTIIGTFEGYNRIVSVTKSFIAANSSVDLKFIKGFVYAES